MTRKADIHDVPAISRIINDCAEHGLMLHRSMSFLYERVREFHVVADAEGVVGVCGLSVLWANLAEVYALAVAPTHRGRGLGKRLVAACVEEAKRLGIRQLMTLTYEQRFFTACEFTTIDRQQLPLKVWSQCLHCAKNQACDEIAMIRALEDVPEPEAPNPVPPSEGRYIVPVPLTGYRPQRLPQRPKMDDPPTPSA